MTFRRVRRSNDGHTWLIFGLSLGGVVGLGSLLFLAFRDGKTISEPHTVLVWVVSVIGLAWSVRAVSSPVEWEFVVEDDLIRWGRSNRLDHQTRVNVSELVRVINDESDGVVFADVGRLSMIPLGDYILFRPRDRAALVGHFRENFPRLKIDVL